MVYVECILNYDRLASFDEWKRNERPRKERPTVSALAMIPGRSERLKWGRSVLKKSGSASHERAIDRVTVEDPSGVPGVSAAVMTVNCERTTPSLG